MINKTNLNNADKTKFSKENQPTPEAKSKGRKRKYLIKKIASEIVKGKAVDDLKPIAEYLGISADKIDIETLMHLKQIEKAIKDNDTKAYNSVMDRINGKPHQSINQSIIDNKTIPILNNDPLCDS